MDVFSYSSVLLHALAVPNAYLSPQPSLHASADAVGSAAGTHHTTVHPYLVSSSEHCKSMCGRKDSSDLQNSLPEVEE